MKMLCPIETQTQACKIPDPLEKYLDWEKLEGSPSYGTVCERVRSKAYHAAEHYFLEIGYSKEDARDQGRLAGRYHLQRFKEKTA